MRKVLNIYIYICVYLYVYVCACLGTYTYLRTYVCLYIQCVRVRVCVCVYICMYVYIQISQIYTWHTERCNERRNHLKPNITNHIFLQTAVVLAELSNAVKRKAYCIGMAKEL